MADEKVAASASGRQSIRASDTDRERVVAILRNQYAEGRLTRAELDERVGDAYAARTWRELSALTADLPATLTFPAEQAADGLGTAAGVDACLLCFLLCVCPPAGIAYWLACRRRFRSASGDRLLLEAEDGVPRAARV